MNSKKIKNEMKFKLVIYADIDGIPPYTDSQLKIIYNRMIAEGKDHVFSDGTIQNADDFVKMAKSENNTLYMVYYENEIVLVVWLNRFEGAMARLNFCSLGRIDYKIKIKAGRFIIDLLTEKVFDLLVGHVPISNQKAIQYSKSCGAKILGTAPNLVWNEKEKRSKPGVILYYEGRNNEDL